MCFAKQTLMSCVETVTSPFTHIYMRVHGFLALPHKHPSLMDGTRTYSRNWCNNNYPRWHWPNPASKMSCRLYSAVFADVESFRRHISGTPACGPLLSLHWLYPRRTVPYPFNPLTVILAIDLICIGCHYLSLAQGDNSENVFTQLLIVHRSLLIAFTCRSISRFSVLAIMSSRLS